MDLTKEELALLIRITKHFSASDELELLDVGTLLSLREKAERWLKVKQRMPRKAVNK